VSSTGADSAKTLTTLRSENKRLTNSAYNANNRRRWADSDWSRTTCGNGFQNNLVAAIGIGDKPGEQRLRKFMWSMGR